MINDQMYSIRGREKKVEEGLGWKPLENQFILSAILHVHEIKRKIEVSMTIVTLTTHTPLASCTAAA